MNASRVIELPCAQCYKGAVDRTPWLWFLCPFCHGKCVIKVRIQ